MTRRSRPSAFPPISPSNPTIARDLLRAGKNVFMEKPMAVSVAEAEEMLEAERAGGGRLMVAYMKRYDSGNETAKRWLDEIKASGELGDIFYARNHGFCGRNWTAGFDATFLTSDEPRPEPPALRGPEWMPADIFGKYISYLQQYAHNVNLLRWFLDAGDDVKVVSVDLDEDAYIGTVNLRVGGVRAVIESGVSSHFGWDEHTQIYFRHGYVKVTCPPLLLRNSPAGVEVYKGDGIQQTIVPQPDDPYTFSYEREAQHFVKCLQTGEPFRSTGQDTLTDVRVFEDIFKMWLAQQ